MKKLTIAFVVGVCLSTVFFTNSCKSANEEDLFPVADTVTVTFDEVLTVLQNPINGCFSCHGRGAMQGGVKLDTYEDIKKYADDGSLVCVVEWSGGCSPMPQGGSQIAEADIELLRTWVNEGAQNK